MVGFLHVNWTFRQYQSKFVKQILTILFIALGAMLTVSVRNLLLPFRKKLNLLPTSVR